MKNLTVTYILATLPFFGFGQRLFKGEQSISFVTGMEDGSSFKSNSYHTAYFGHFSYSRVNNNKTRWVVGAYGDIKSYKVLDNWARTKIFAIDGGLYIPALINYKRSWILSFGLGLNVGYEYLNGNAKDLYISAGRIVDSKGIYGGYLGLENEVYLSEKIIWLIDCSLRYFQKSGVTTNFQYNFGTGIKLRLRT